MTHEEFKSKRLMKRNKSEPKFLSLFNAVPSVGMAINKEQLKDLPESVDWRTHTGILTPVKN
jgi:hypothetical protein